MAELDRAALIELLGRLGGQDDAMVLQAARELHRTVSQSGATWDDLIRAQLLAPEAPTSAEPAGAPSDRTPSADQPAAPAVAAPDRGETTRLIERLLARKELSANLRAELTEMKRTLADGTLDSMDSRYIRALAKRLGV